MKSWRVLLRAVVFAGLSAHAIAAQAFLDPPLLAPSRPVAGDVVAVNVAYGVCDAIIGINELSQNGSAIRVVLSGIHYDDPFMCNLPSATGTYPIGLYAPGAYTVQIDFFYNSVIGVPETIPLGVVPFEVSRAVDSAASAPVNDPRSLALLLSVLAMFGSAAVLGRERRAK